jgi:hypothetical protein
MVSGRGRSSVQGVPAGLTVQVAVEKALRQFDHSDNRGSMPHNRDLSGAASDKRNRGFAFRWAPRPQPVQPSVSSTSPRISKLCRLAQCFSLFGFNFHPNGPDESQQFGSYCGDPLFRCFFAARHELSVAPSNFTHLFQFRDTLVRISPLRDLQRLLYVGELGT